MALFRIFQNCKWTLFFIWCNWILLYGPEKLRVWFFASVLVSVMKDTTSISEPMEDWQCWTPVSVFRNCDGSALGIGLKYDSKAFCLVLVFFPPAILLRQTGGQNLEQTFWSTSKGILLLEIHIELSVIWKLPTCVCSKDLWAHRWPSEIRGKLPLHLRTLALTLYSDSF